MLSSFLKEAREGKSHHESHQEEYSIQWGHQKQNITQLFVRFINRRVELWNDKNIDITLTVAGTIITPIGRKIWSKILGKASVKKLVNKCSCFKICAMFNRKPMQFHKHRSYTGVFTVFDTTLAALFWMHYS